jgi:protein SCO1/2
MGHAVPQRHRTGAALLVLLILSLPLLAVKAAPFGQEQALAASRAAVGGALSDHLLRDVDGRSVRLHDLRGRPMVVNLVFSSCHGSCGVITRRLAQAVAVARDALGATSFTVITMGFDAANDTPGRMASYAKSHGIGDANWLVLSADDGTARAFARELGFTFVPSPRGFDHVSQVTIVSADGQVYRQVYSDVFPTPALVEPLKELVWGIRSRAPTLDGWLNGLKLICTVYDPSADRYRFDYSVFIAAGAGILCLGGVAAFVVKAWIAGGGRHEV